MTVQMIQMPRVISQIFWLTATFYWKPRRLNPDSLRIRIQNIYENVYPDLHMYKMKTIRNHALMFATLSCEIILSILFSLCHGPNIYKDTKP
jgi:hypothetical protein